MIGKITASVVVVLVLSVGIGSAATQQASTARNGLIAFAGTEPRISPRVMVVRPDGTGLRALTRPGQECAGARCGGTAPAFSPDGRQLAYAKQRGLYTYDLVSGRIVEWGAYSGAPSWSPTGQEIVTAGPGWLVVHGMKGGSRVIHRTREWIDSPAWSPAGTPIAFTAEDIYQVGDHAQICGPWLNQIYTILPSGKGLRQLTSDGNNVHPAWSPDGRRIAYINILPPARIRLMTMRADGSDKRVVRRLDLAPCWERDMGLAWSPDGRKFAAVIDGQIATLNVDGSGVRYLATGLGSLDWQRLP